MENVTADVVKEYGRELAEKVNSGELSASTAQNYISAVNSVMNIATQNKWESVSPTRDCNIAQRSAVRQDAPGAIDRAAYSRAVDAVRAEVGERAAAVVELARELGLRSKEASLIDARAALSEAHARGTITVRDGTKGGREREVPAISAQQLAVLGRAAAAQGSSRAVMPPGETGKAGAKVACATPASWCSSTPGAACTTCGPRMHASAIRRSQATRRRAVVGS